MSYVFEQEQKTKPHWVRYILGRVKKNKNFLGFLSGQTGSGKSWSAISIGEMIDPQFNVDQVVFTGTELMQLIDSNRLKPGSTIVWEEVGVNMGNRNWQSAVNKGLSYILQTFRHRRFVLLFTAPYIDFLDSSARRLLHAVFETQSIDHKKKTCLVKPLSLQYNAEMRKMYRKYLRVITPNGAVPIVSWEVPAPSKALRDAYEAKKTEFTSKLFNDTRKEFEQLDGVQRKPLTDKQNTILTYLKDKKTIDVMCEVTGLTTTTLYRHIKALKKKGYIINPIKEGNTVQHYEVLG